MTPPRARKATETNDAGQPIDAATGRIVTEQAQQDAQDTNSPDPAPAAHDSLSAALAAFQADMPAVHKANTASIKSDKGSYSYRYADLADICRAAMPVLARHGLSFTTRPSIEGGGIILTGVLRHTSGDSDEGALPIVGRTPQEVGSALTYARRYLLGCMTGIVTDDDDDGAAATKAAQRPQQDPQQEQREQQERLHAEQERRRTELARQIATATASPDVVADLRTDVLMYADTITAALPRKEQLLATWREAAGRGALGCEVRLPDSWREHTQGPEVCTLHQLIEGAQDVNLPPSGEQATADSPDEDPWATTPGQEQTSE